MTSTWVVSAFFICKGNWEMTPAIYNIEVGAEEGDVVFLKLF